MPSKTNFPSRRVFLPRKFPAIVRFHNWLLPCVAVAASRFAEKKLVENRKTDEPFLSCLVAVYLFRAHTKLLHPSSPHGRVFFSLSPRLSHCSPQCFDQRRSYLLLCIYFEKPRQRSWNRIKVSVGKSVYSPDCVHCRIV